jgi:hypothetical protein
MRYITVSESLAMNGRRHDARALGWLMAGRLGYAIGSLRKAERNYRHALMLETFHRPFQFVTRGNLP